jgi:SAM-dependent methyltransferase
MTREQYLEQFRMFDEQSKADGRFTPRAEDQFAVLDDDADQTIHISWEYLMHTSWAARQLAKSKPQRHVDVGSYVYFAGLCSAWVPRFEFYDVRPINCPMPNLHCLTADITKLPFADGEIESLSCMHVMEHIGLGRYGDALDASGDRKAAAELSRVLAPGGHLLMVLPMNEKPRVVFNAHRFYSSKQVDELFPALRMIKFMYLWDERVNTGPLPSEGNCCGCMVFTT